MDWGAKFMPGVNDWFVNTFPSWLASEDSRRLFAIALILIAMRVVGRRVQGAVRLFINRTQAPTEMGILIGRAARFGVLLIGVYLILDRLGLEQAAVSFVTGLGIAGIVIGFALQDIVKQLAAGTLLLMLRPFSTGDQIKVDSFEGTVVEIQLRVTVLKTEDGDEVLIPNANVYTNAVVNKSRYMVRRRTLDLKIPSDDQTDRIPSALLRATIAIIGVVAEPPPTIVVTGIEDDMMLIELRYWIDVSKYNSDAITNQVIATSQQVLAQNMKDSGHTGSIKDHGDDA